jgi:hypothetical protein
MRKDGKFVGADGSVPEGQAIVMAHLNECHELIEMVGTISLYLGLIVAVFDNRFQLKEAMNEDEDEEEYEDEEEDDDDTTQGQGE